MNTKICSTCKVEKPINNFYRNKNQKDGRNRYCKECYNVYRIRWIAQNYGRYRESQRKASKRYNRKNPKAASAASRAWEAKKIQENPDFLKARRRHQVYNDHKITEQIFEEMLSSQNNTCAICQGGPEFGFGIGKWNIDHDHACCPKWKSCGKCIRGILCPGCNVGLGQFQDNPLKLFNAILYLGKYNGIGTVN